MESFPGVRERAQPRLSGVLVFGFAVLIVVLIVLGIVDFATEWLWFDSLGFASVFTTTMAMRLALFLGGFVVFFVLFAANVLIARRLAYRLDTRPRRMSVNATWEDLLTQIGAQMSRRGGYSRMINVAVLGGGIALSLFMGLWSTGSWLQVLQLINRTSFGITDPVFGLDVSVHLFVMPVLRTLEGWTFMAWVLVGLSVAAVYAVVVTYELAVNIGQSGFPVSRGIKAHILALAAFGFVLIASHHLLDLIDLVRSSRGSWVGAGYTDMTAQRPALIILAGFALLAAALCILSVFRRGLRLVILGAGLWVAALVLVGWAYPTVIQSIDVTPNELDRERPYIANAIRFTRDAFRLAGISEQDVAYQDTVSASALAAERDTISNIRLWDHRPLGETFRQIQAIRQYYTFTDVDVDRYVIDGQYRQVMIAARELVPDQLPRSAQSWVSRELQYTHGYGVVANQVNQISDEGLPILAVRDVPPIGQIPITRPEIYFGERTPQYVITRTATPEFDYPSGDSGVFVSRYMGEAGVSVGSSLSRLLFALKFQDPNFMLNSAFREDSELLYRRNIVDRAREIAPFLRLDPDPYIVIADGGLYWIQDAYTVSDRYPYSESYAPPQADGLRRPARSFNYIRNSVKIVTNAYDGTVRFYIADATDPMIQTYAKAFPALFVPQEQAPASIRAHFRYPEEMFRIQAEKYRLYHIQDPRVFYLQEDQWQIPNEMFQGRKQPVEPYYVIMQLPGAARPEFILMIPFTPANRENMIGWLGASSDEPNYGRMVVYKYPKDTVIYGPLQIEARIDQDAVISQQFALWNQAGTQVIRGNLLTIPIGQSNLYVEPIYLQAKDSPLPELKRIVVANGNKIVMEATLEQSLGRLFGNAASTTPPGAQPTPGTPQQPIPTISPEVSQLTALAQQQYQRAQEALRAGDFTRYGDEIRALGQTIDRLAQLSAQ